MSARADDDALTLMVQTVGEVGWGVTVLSQELLVLRTFGRLTSGTYEQLASTVTMLAAVVEVQDRAVAALAKARAEEVRG